MTDQAKHSKRHMDGVSQLKQGFLLKFAMLRHHGTEKSEALTDHLTADVRKINEELEATQLRVQQSYPGSDEEANCLVRIRELEDIRFQLLSQINGNQLEAYNSLAPHYPRQ